MIYFAYDGSINGDWVSHYAVRLAENGLPRRLNVIHVSTSSFAQEEFVAKLERIRLVCERHQVEFVLYELPKTKHVAEAVRSVIAGGADDYLVCGTRVRSQARSLLRGTASEHWLQSGHCNVLAVRVLQPGLLGLPRRLLLPVSGHPRGFSSGMPFLRLFAPHISHIHLLHVIRIGRVRSRWLSAVAIEKSRLFGEEFCRNVEEEICQQLDLACRIVDSHVVIAETIPEEIVISANKTKSRLIFMGGSERTLGGGPVEHVLQNANCDVAIYRGVE